MFAPTDPVSPAPCRLGLAATAAVIGDRGRGPARRDAVHLGADRLKPPAGREIVAEMSRFRAQITFAPGQRPRSTEPHPEHHRAPDRPELFEPQRGNGPIDARSDTEREAA